MGQQTGPRYSEIVAALRQRIETGDLAPGDPVPSTREITRQWGVAMATATKALTELRHLGLVRAVRGVGTVVEGTDGRGADDRSRGTRRPPTVLRGEPSARRGGGGGPGPIRERIVAAAIAVADTEGLAAVSMRRVAAELGMATMSLYRHVTDKDDLLVQMMDDVFRRCPWPEPPPDGWRDQLTDAAHLLWALFRRHPWLAPAMSMTRPQPVPSAMPLTERLLTALDGVGLDPSTAFTAYITLINYVRGTAVNIETEADAAATSGLDTEEWMDAQEPAMRAILDAGHFPVMRRLTAQGYDFDLDALFEFGLQRLLDGFAAFLGAAGS